MIIFYLSTVHVLHDDNNTFTFIIGVINMLATIASLYLLQRLGRKQLLLIGQLMMWGANCLLFQIFNQKNMEVTHAYTDTISLIIIALIVMFLISFAITIGPIWWIFLVEIMTEIGVGIAVSVNWIVVIIVSFLPLIVNCGENEITDWDISGFFFIFSGMWIVGFFLISLFVKETKDMSPFQIMTLYKENEYNPLSEE